MFSAFFSTSQTSCSLPSAPAMRTPNHWALGEMVRRPSARATGKRMRYALAPRRRVREVSPLDGARTAELDSMSLGAVSLPRSSMRPDDPGRVFGGEIRPLVPLGVQRDVELMKVVDLGG